MFLDMISRMNAVFDDAERIGCKSCLEGTFAWLSLFTIHLCTRTTYEKVRVTTKVVVNNITAIHEILIRVGK